MYNFKVKGGFECDRQSKYDYTASTVNYIKNKMTGRTVVVIFKELDKDGNEVEFDSVLSDKQSRNDLIMYYNGTKYVIELKERLNPKYHSEYYGKEGDKEGWMLNIEKYYSLKKAKNAIPLYVNLYKDNVVRVWNLDKIDSYSTINKPINKYTVKNSEVINQDRYEVWNKDAITIKRVKGEKSNGIWASRT